MSSGKLPASLSSISVPSKQSPVTTDYIINRVHIDGRYFSNAMCSGYQDKILATKCDYQDLYCRSFFMGIGKSFIINCYELQNLFICYINFLARSSYFLCSGTSNLTEIQMVHMKTYLYCNHADTFLYIPNPVRDK